MVPNIRGTISVGSDMRTVFACASLLGLSALVCPGQTATDLADLYGAHQYFEYRDAVDKMAKPTELESGIVACVFNDLRGCERHMGRVLRSRASDDDKIIAHRQLSYLNGELGRNRSALLHHDANLKLTSNAPPPSDGVMRAFARSPELSVLSFHPSRFRYDLKQPGIRIPVRINGISGTYILDSGAERSAVGESEAKRTGMRIVELPPYNLTRITGAKQTANKIALAERLDLGEIHLANVPFVIVPDLDSDPAVGPRTGALGIQVLLACRTMRWTNEGSVELGFVRSRRDIRAANIYVDNYKVYARAEFRGKQMDFHLDTGGISFLLESFREAFPQLVKESGVHAKVGDLNGVRDVPALEGVELTMGKGRAALPPAPILTVPGAHGFGLLGADAFKNAHSVTLDFHRMILTVE